MNEVLREPLLTEVCANVVVRPLEFSTRQLAPVDQFDEFRAAYHGVLDIELTHCERDSFLVRQYIWRLDKILLVDAQLPGRGYAFQLSEPRQAMLDHWVLLLPINPVAAEPARIRPGAPTLQCLAKPFQVEVEAHGLIALFIPRGLLALPDGSDSAPDGRLRGGASHLLADFLVQVVHQLPQLQLGELPGIAEALQGLVASCVATRLGRPEGGREAAEMTLLGRARWLIDHKLTDPELSPTTLCRELFVSRSRLYRMFEPLGGVAAFIRHRRLLRARDALVDRTETRSIVRIAEQLGFADASAFSRTFKQEFGISPRRMREKCLAQNDRPHGGSDQRATSTKASNAGLLLRCLGAL